MLVFLISAAWLAVVFFTLSMCRVGARSDEAPDVALRERIAAAAFEGDASVVREEEPALYSGLRA